MITDTEARRIASEWHGGGGTALYAFASTGAINTAREDHDIDAELRNCLAPASFHGEQERTRVQLLRVYTMNHGPRGPQPGWADLTW